MVAGCVNRSLNSRDDQRESFGLYTVSPTEGNDGLEVGMLRLFWHNGTSLLPDSVSLNVEAFSGRHDGRAKTVAATSAEVQR